MKAYFALILISLSAGFALAGPEQIIKQRAKDLRDQNNARQGVQPASPAPAAPAQKPSSAAPATVSPAQQSLMRFQADLAGIQAGAVMDSALKEKLVHDLSGAAQTKKPSAAAVDKLVTALFQVFAAKPLAAMPRTLLVRDLDAVLNPAKYPQAKMPAIYDDFHKILISNRVPIALAAQADAALRALGEEVQK